jgi:hypothetical protein
MKMIFSCSQPQFAVLPPACATVPATFRNVQVNSRRHEDLLSQMQRLRGHVYLQDGAIRPEELTRDGRHKLRIDDTSWHVLSMDPNGKVVACLRYVEEGSATNFRDLWVRHASVASCPVSGARFRRTVEQAMKRARQLEIGFGEVGGWAVAEDRRLTLEPLRILLATYGLLELLGSAAGVATATVRHGSSTILRKIGLTALEADGEELAPYYDPNYGCQMEVLQFDSRFPNPKYQGKVRELSASLITAPVVCRETRATSFCDKWRGLEVSPVNLPMSPVLAGV